jgi:hypothetical protein
MRRAPRTNEIGHTSECIVGFGYAGTGETLEPVDHFGVDFEGDVDPARVCDLAKANGVTVGQVD